MEVKSTLEKLVGLGYHLRPNQLDYIAEQGKNIDSKTIYTKLDDYLQKDIHGKSSRVKVATILLRIWYFVPPEYQSLRDRALELYSRLTPPERLILHWGMLLLTHPFFRDITAELGNLFILQHEVPSSQIYRKMRSIYGDKERVNVATKSALATLRYMEYLDSSKKAVYTQPKKREIYDLKLKNWLAEVVILASGKDALPIDLIPSSPVLYPVHLQLNTADIDSPSLGLIRQGLDMNMVCLKKSLSQ
jgi:hypothetical protein